MTKKTTKKKKTRKHWRKLHPVIILKAVVVILIFISFFVPWHHDYASESNKDSWETNWHLQSYYVTHKNASFDTEMQYSYPGPDNLHNASIVWNTTFYLTILTFAAVILSLLCSIKVKNPKRKIKIITELIALLFVLSTLCYFTASYPNAIMEDAKNISTLNPCIIQHASTKAFSAVISDGTSGSWFPGYGWFLMMGGLITYILLVEHRVRIFLGKVYLKMLDEAERLRKAERK